MLRPVATLTALAMTAALAQPAAATAGSAAFVDAFATACVPKRLSYEGSVAQALKTGWTAFDASAHPEFAAVMAKSTQAVAEGKAEGYLSGFAHRTFAREVAGRKLHLVVSYTRSKILDLIGCYIYDFAAEGPVDPDEVTRILGLAPGQVMDTAEIVTRVWGPPPAMPRTHDTYLTYVPPGSPLVEKTGFDGAVLKFTTAPPRRKGRK